MKILVVQPYGFGNSVLATPLLKAIHSLPKKHTIHCAYDVKRWAAGAILKDIPFVQKVFGMNDPQTVREKYDLVIACSYQPSFKTKYNVPRILLPMPKRPPNTSQQAYQPIFKKHEVEYLLDAARHLGFVGDTPYPFIGKVEEVKFADDRKRVVFGIGYYKGDAWSRKKHWGNDQFAQLADDIAILGGEVYIIGGPRDVTDARAIASMAKSSPRIMCGKFGLHMTFGLIKACDCFVGNDTGFAHAAAALGVPTMGVFRFGVSSTKKSAPMGPKATHVVVQNVVTGYVKIQEWLQKTVLLGE